MKSSLIKKLNDVEWGMFKISSLFEIENTLSFNSDKLVPGNEYDYVTRTSQNQGVLRKTGFINTQNINSAGNWSLGLLQMDFFYRQNPWYAGQFIRKITPKIDVNPLVAQFLTVALNKLKPILSPVLVRNIDEILLNLDITLPINQSGDIDFDFMESFIVDIETDRVDSIRTYLNNTGLKNYTLTAQEQKALAEYDNLSWGSFRIGDLCERIKTKKLPFKAEDLPKEKVGDYDLPCLTSSFNNQGLNYFAPRGKATILKNVISIPSNSDVYRAYFQPNEFTVLSDAYAIDWIYQNRKLKPHQYLFVVQCINKITDLPIYSYKNKLGGWNVVKDKYIQLPIIKEGEPNYEVMGDFISAMLKKNIESIVLYAEKNNHI